jgi:hypothetical protein
MKRLTIILFAFMIATMTGCISSEIVVEPTRQWEGHFFTTNEV